MAGAREQHWRCGALSLGEQYARGVAMTFGGNDNSLSDAKKGSQVRCAVLYTHTILIKDADRELGEVL